MKTKLMVPRRGVLLGGAALAGAGLLPQSLWAQTPIKIAGIYTVPVEQQWVSRIHMAAEAAVAAGQADYTYTENTANTDYPRVMREYCEAGMQLIVGEIFGAEAEAREVCLEYPNVAFLLGSSFPPDATPNLGVFDNYIQDAAYLSGIIAGAMTTTGKIGMVGGFPIPEVNRLMNAFMAGVRETRADATFQVSFIGSWFDPPKAKETAFAMIDAGADLVYAERFGVSDAAKERGILAIGNVIDTQADYPDTVVASALWHFEPTLQAALAAVTAGSFAAADYGQYSFMKAGGCSLAPLGTFDAKVPQAAKDMVAAKQAGIMDGSFAVTIDDSEPKSS